MAVRKIEYKNSYFNISYEILNLDNNKAILFLHGWGSNKEIMKNAFGSLFKKYTHIYIDMPGFGKSSNELVLNSFDYCDIIASFLKHINIDPDIIVGHSFGGKIATLLSPKLLVLLSSAGIVEKKPLKIKIKIIIFKILKKIGFSFLYPLFVSQDVKSMKENMYKTFKNVVDEDFSDNFRNFSNRALIFWGKDDTSTPLLSGLSIKKLIKNSSFIKLNGDHYFFIQNNKTIQEVIDHERY